VHAESVPAPKIETEAVLRNVITTIASALRPRAMVGGPMLRAILLPGSMPRRTAALL
jgi:hypothetical protein